MKPHFIRALIVLALLSLTAAACVVRSRPSRSRHTVVHHDDHRGGHGKHKKHKKHAKHKKHKKHR